MTPARYPSGQMPAYQTGQMPAYQTGQMPAYNTGRMPAYQTGQMPAYQAGQMPARQTAQMTNYGTGQMPAYRTGQMPAYPSARQMPAYGNTGLGWSAPAPPPMPAYPSTATFAVSGTRPLRVYRRRRSSRWGLKFSFLVALVAAGAWYLRDDIKWVDDQVTAIEIGVRNWAGRYAIPVPDHWHIGEGGTRYTTIKPKVVATAEPVAEPPPAVESLDSESPSAEGPEGGAARVAALAPDEEAAERSFKVQKMKSMARARTKRARNRRRPLRNTRRVALAGRASGVGASDEGFAPLDDPMNSLPAAPAAEPAAGDEFPPLEKAPGAPAPSKAEPVLAAEEDFPPVDEPTPAPAPVPTSQKRKKLVRDVSSTGNDLDTLMAGALDPVPPKKVGSVIDQELAKGEVEQRTGARERVLKKEPAALPLKAAQIKTVMNRVQSEVKACYTRYRKRGQAAVKVDVAPSGRVRTTLIQGEFAGTPTGQCVESKLKQARFPQSSGLNFDYMLRVR